jgi:hypothetical protein
LIFLFPFTVKPSERRSVQARLFSPSTAQAPWSALPRIPPADGIADLFTCSRIVACSDFNDQETAFRLHRNRKNIRCFQRLRTTESCFYF